jgi:hypothetical protein
MLLNNCILFSLYREENETDRRGDLRSGSGQRTCGCIHLHKSYTATTQIGVRILGETVPIKVYLDRNEKRSSRLIRLSAD